jgi:hypothetical protein
MDLMKKFLILLFALVCPILLRAEIPPEIPSKVITTEDFRQLLLATKWIWKNEIAKAPDRECVFMADGTFRHPNFVAKFIIKDVNTVELIRKGGRAKMIFDPTYLKFEAVDFENHRITGVRK